MHSFYGWVASVGLWFSLLLSALWWRRLRGLCKLPAGRDVLLWLLCLWTWAIFFFGGFQCSPVDACSTTSCDFGVLPGGDEHMSFYSAILNQELNPFNFLMLRCPRAWSLDLFFVCESLPWWSYSVSWFYISIFLSFFLLLLPLLPLPFLHFCITTIITI